MTAIRRLKFLAPIAALSLAACGINSVPTAEENVNAKWGNKEAVLLGDFTYDRAAARPRGAECCFGNQF